MLSKIVQESAVKYQLYFGNIPRYSMKETEVMIGFITGVLAGALLVLAGILGVTHKN